jgi:transposase-like protein
MLPDDLPEDMPSFLVRFGSDEQCREYLFMARWPDGFRCAACGHGDAYALRTKIVYECAACPKQHSLLAGTIFEQTKTGLAKWFLAIYLVTSSKGGIAAAELQRQLGLGSYQTAWTWLHKLREAMVRPDRQPLAGRVEADETYVGGPRPGKRGRGAAGKTLVAGAVEAGRGGARGRRLGRLRLAPLADASAESLDALLAAHVTKPATVATDGWRGHLGLPAAGYDHEPVSLGTSRGDAALRLPGIRLVFGLAKRWLLGTHHGAVSEKHLPAYLDQYVFRFNRRTAGSISHGFARLVEHAVRIKPTSYRDLVAPPAPA